MKISDFTCGGNEPHSFTMEIPDGVSYEKFAKETPCSKCGSPLIKTEESSSDAKETNKI